MKESLRILGQKYIMSMLHENDHRLLYKDWGAFIEYPDYITWVYEGAPSSGDECYFYITPFWDSGDHIHYQSANHVGSLPFTLTYNSEEDLQNYLKVVKEVLDKYGPEHKREVEKIHSGSV